MDLVRVAYVRGFNDGLGGALFTDGLSNEIPRQRAVRIAVSLGARIVEAGEEPWPSPAPAAVDPAPVEEPPAPSPDAPAPRVTPRPIPYHGMPAGTPKPRR